MGPRTSGLQTMHASERLVNLFHMIAERTSKGLPFLKNSLRTHPGASIYWHNNNTKQHHVLTVRPQSPLMLLAHTEPLN